MPIQESSSSNPNLWNTNISDTTRSLATTSSNPNPATEVLYPLSPPPTTPPTTIENKKVTQSPPGASSTITQVFNNSIGKNGKINKESEEKEKSIRKNPITVLNQILDKENASSLKITKELKKVNNYWDSTIPPNNRNIIMALGVTSYEAAINTLELEHRDPFHTDLDLLRRFHTLKLLESWTAISLELNKFDEFKNIYKAMKKEDKTDDEIIKEFLFTVILPVTLKPEKLGFEITITDDTGALSNVTEDLTKLVNNVNENEIETGKLKLMIKEIIKNLTT